MPKPPKIPTADEEALQQPTIDPIMLLTSMLSGGISGFQNASTEQQSIDALRKVAMPGLRELLQDIPVAKNTIMDALGGGMNFGSGAALNHQIMPNHPLLSNMLALPIAPAGLINNAEEPVEKWLLRNHPGIKDILGRLKPLAATPLLLRDTDKKNAK